MFCVSYFFFSSRRRHTRFDCDWSSDVCSSDLNVNGTVLAIANRCTHARASLSEGTLDPARCAITCPWHEGVFSLETGQVLGGPPALPIAVYRVKLEGDTVLIAPAEAREPTVAPRA